MDRTLVTAEHVHGRTGLDGPTLPDPKIQLQADHAVDYLVETLRDTPDVTVCPLAH